MQFVKCFVCLSAMCWLGNVDGIAYKIWNDVNCGDKNDDYKASSLVECGAICKATSFDDRCRIATYNVTSTTCSIPQPADVIVCSPNDVTSASSPETQTFYNTELFTDYFANYAPHGVFLEMKDLYMANMYHEATASFQTFESCAIYCSTNHTLMTDSINFEPGTCICTWFSNRLLLQSGKSLTAYPGWTFYERIY